MTYKMHIMYHGTTGKTAVAHREIYPKTSALPAKFPIH